MPLSFDIAQPVSEQKVGTTVGVSGTFSGDAGNPFSVRCSIDNATYNSTQSVEPNMQTGTWQCTFSDVPVGKYDISAQVASTVGANPATDVEVVANPPVRVTPPVTVQPPGTTLAAAPGGKNYLLPLRGTTAPGYGFADGYVVSCYLMLAGSQVSSVGRLTTFYSSGAGNEWRYDLSLPAWAWSDAAILLVELWRVGFEKPESKPAATVTYPIVTKG